MLNSSLFLLSLLACAQEVTEVRPWQQVGEVRKLGGGMGFVEGPVWLPAEKRLVFSDIPRSKLMQWTEADGVTEWRDSANANGNILDLEGRLLSCQHGARNLIRIDAEGAVEVLADRFDGKRFNSPNDVAVRSDGTLWFTDPPWGLPRQSEGRELEGHYVFRLDLEDGNVTAVLTDRCMPNGIAFSPDENTLYVADTGGHPSHPDAQLRKLPATVSAYRVLPDQSLAVEPLWRIETICDGMCVDKDGRIYATGRTGVTVWSSEGKPLGEIKVPEQPANVCLGGPQGRTLFITARTSLYAAEL